MNRLFAMLGAVAVACVLAGPASAAAPTNTGNPTIEGSAEQPFVGDTLRATRGSWSGTPTSYTYQWDRCDAVGDRRNCGPISGATGSTYTVQKADVSHTLRVRVTARNTDGSATKDSKGTGVVSDNAAPKNTVKPQVGGSATVGSTVTAQSGTWAGASSFAYQWQQCDTVGNACADVSGATGKAYTVRSADTGRTLRVQVTGTNKHGSAKEVSDHTAVVTAGGPSSTTTVVTTTVAGNKAPTISFLSLKVRANRVYARFRVCDDSFSKVTVVERDQKAKRVAYTRKFAVNPSSCGTYSRGWNLIARFRGPGRLVVTLRAIDKSQRLSRPASRSVVLR